MSRHTPKQNWLFSKLVVCMVLLAVAVNYSNGYTMSPALQKKMERCCKSDLTSPSSPFNKTDCFKMIETELNRQEITHSMSFRYMKKLWRFVSIATKKYEKKEDSSVHQWTINALKPESTTLDVIVFNRNSSQAISDTNVTDNTKSRDLLTLLELLIPYQPVHFCRRKVGDQKNITVSYNGDVFSNEESTIPFRNVLVFRLSQPSAEDISTGKRTITLNMDFDLVYIRPKGAILVEYYNMNKTVTDKIHALAMARARKPKNVTKRKDSGIRRWSFLKNRRNQENEDGSTDPGAEKNIQKRSASLLPIPMPKNFCQVRKYVVNVNTHLDWREVLQPIHINIGMCSGTCNAVNRCRADTYSTGRSVILNLWNKMSDARSPSPRPRCVPHTMRATSMLIYRHESEVTTIFNLQSAEIVSCRCA